MIRTNAYLVATMLFALPVHAETAAQPPEGKELYIKWCADCHDPGPGHAGTLRMAGDFGPDNAVMKTLPGLNRALIEQAVRNGFQMMPPFRPTEINDAELAALTDYLLENSQ